MKVGIIGGSGLDDPDILKNSIKKEVDTPYGKPTSPLTIGTINGIDVVLIGRHGSEHTVTPTNVNYRANIHALKDAGCTHILATTAVGSLRKDIDRGDLVILDQFIDFTRRRSLSFHETFEPHAPVHTPMAEPFSSSLRDTLIKQAETLKLKHHKQGTVITIEGPRFSTKAESKMFRAWGADVINMSIAPEAILANEANIPYAAVAMSTDFDCLFDDVEPVTWDDILKVFKQNVTKVTDLLISTISNLKENGPEN
ncbi:S-methyl-5'-thioadenosine phosphorylase [archaeon]|nr:S-methyl-5'-thioadenosine phosphorylase [archaeon]